VQGLCREWIAGLIGIELGVPIPPFVQAFVSDHIVRDSMIEDIQDLGSGVVFASAKVDGAEDMKLNHIKHVDMNTKQTLLVFDWWLQNEDRTLGPRGGNPNLLWQPTLDRMFVIDHNNAFDLGFSLVAFRKNHIFADVFGQLTLDRASELQPQILHISDKIDAFFDELPEQWVDQVELNPTPVFDIMKNIVRRTLYDDVSSSHTNER
jgi:hypothetical protein